MKDLIFNMLLGGVTLAALLSVLGRQPKGWRLIVGCLIMLSCGGYGLGTFLEWIARRIL